MNLKQNVWMYLFFASVLLWVGTVTFSCEAAPKTADKTEEGKTGNMTGETAELLQVDAAPCQTDPNEFQLTPKVAEERINQYKRYGDQFPSVDTSTLTQKDVNKIINADVEYFHLPRCELNDMLTKVGKGADIKAHLALKEVTVNNVQVREIVLVFEDTSTTTGKYYYDFVHPCPTKCAG